MAALVEVESRLAALETMGRGQEDSYAQLQALEARPDMNVFAASITVFNGFGLFGMEASRLLLHEAVAVGQFSEREAEVLLDIREGRLAFAEQRERAGQLTHIVGEAALRGAFALPEDAVEEQFDRIRQRVRSGLARIVPCTVPTGPGSIAVMRDEAAGGTWMHEGSSQFAPVLPIEVTGDPGATRIISNLQQAWEQGLQGDVALDFIRHVQDTAIYPGLL